MSARRSGRGGGRRARRGGVAESESEERWLLTYADMITLLMALFMVLFSITSVNKSKLEILSKTLQDAFSGKVLPGGESIRDSGASPDSKTATTTAPPIPAITAIVGKTPNATAAALARKEQEDFRKLKEQIDAYARERGIQDKVQTIIAQRGLVIRLLTDNVLFDSGLAALKPEATPVLTKVASILRQEARHKVMVEGHTDVVPIHGSVFPTNWELSTARASRVVRFLISAGVTRGRLSAAGYSALHPIDTNQTAAGRSRNRRVEIVLLRSRQGTASHGGETP